MASTNKTTNYELSQFLGTDKPAWLTDYNADMGKIDVAIKNASDTATSASGTATSASTAVGTLANLTTDVKTDLVSAVNEVDANADTAQTTANNASTQATTNASNIAILARQFNLTNIGDLTFTKAGFTFANNSMKYAINQDYTIAKIYGRVTIAGNATGWQTATSNEKPFASLGLASPITLASSGFSFSPQEDNLRGTALVINTDGSVTINVYIYSVSGDYPVQYVPCLYILQDFGDIISD